MFGRDYEEIGSSDKGLILKNSGKVKILWGNKLIDLLDSKGNINTKVNSLIKEVSSESEINDDGFYLQDGVLLAKSKKNLVKLASKEGSIYVSFLEELKTTEELKYIALQNIGFLYPTKNESNIYPKNGIIYIEDTKKLYIVNNGILNEYTVSIPNPFLELFIISKNNKEEGSLVIEGEGKSNSLRFNSLKIYSKENQAVFDTNNRYSFKINDDEKVSFSNLGIETSGILSKNANSSSGFRIYKEGNKYILDIDLINLRSNGDLKDLLDKIKELEEKIHVLETRPITLACRPEEENE